MQHAKQVKQKQAPLMKETRTQSIIFKYQRSKRYITMYDARQVLHKVSKSRLQPLSTISNKTYKMYNQVCIPLIIIFIAVRIKQIMAFSMGRNVNTKFYFREIAQFCWWMERNNLKMVSNQKKNNTMGLYKEGRRWNLQALPIESSKSSDGSSKKFSVSTFCISENKASSSSFDFAGSTFPKLLVLLW